MKTLKLKYDIPKYGLKEEEEVEVLESVITPYTVSKWSHNVKTPEGDVVLLDSTLFKDE